MDTKGLLILPKQWRKLWAEYREYDLKSVPLSTMSFASIREKSERPGETRHRFDSQIGSITLIDTYTSQKRWYKALVLYSQEGISEGLPMSEFLYVLIQPWMLNQLIAQAARRAARRKE